MRPLGAAPLALVLSAVILAGCQPEAKGPPPPRQARVIEADPKEVPITVDGSGQIEARTTTNVGFLVSGRLASRAVDVGAVVKVGDTIGKLDPTDLQNKLDSANASVKAAEAGVQQAAPQEAAKRKLLADGFTTQADYDMALQNLQTAQANLTSAQANQRLAESQLAYATLNAPVAGAITKTGADPGQVVDAGQMVVEIAQTDALDAVFSVSARVATNAAPGAKVDVALQDDPNVKLVGTLREISPAADPVTGTYTVRVTLDNPPPQMRLGALVLGHAEVPGEVLVKLPPTALLQTGDTAQVWIVGADGTVSKKPVTVVRYDTDAVYIKDGVEKGEMIVAQGVNSLAEGQKVEPAKVAAP